MYDNNYQVFTISLVAAVHKVKGHYERITYAILCNQQILNMKVKTIDKFLF